MQTYVNPKGEVVQIGGFCRLSNPCSHSAQVNGIYKQYYNGLELFTYLFENDFGADALQHFEYLRPRYYRDRTKKMIERGEKYEDIIAVPYYKESLSYLITASITYADDRLFNDVLDNITPKDMHNSLNLCKFCISCGQIGKFERIYAFYSKTEGDIFQDYKYIINYFLTSNAATSFFNWLIEKGYINIEELVDKNHSKIEDILQMAMSHKNDIILNRAAVAITTNNTSIKNYIFKKLLEYDATLAEQLREYVFKRIPVEINYNAEDIHDLRQECAANDLDVCAICLEDLKYSNSPNSVPNDAKLLYKLDCNHIFHKSCICQIKPSGKFSILPYECPLCRKEFALSKPDHFKGLRTRLELINEHIVEHISWRSIEFDFPMDRILENDIFNNLEFHLETKDPTASDICSMEWTFNGNSCLLKKKVTNTSTQLFVLSSIEHIDIRLTPFCQKTLIIKFSSGAQPYLTSVKIKLDIMSAKPSSGLNFGFLSLEKIPPRVSAADVSYRLICIMSSDGGVCFRHYNYDVSMGKIINDKPRLVGDNMNWGEFLTRIMDSPYFNPALKEYISGLI